MNGKLFKLIGKNFRLITRSKVSSLIIFFGPLIIMLLAGFAFNNTGDLQLDVAIHMPTMSELAQRFNESLDDRFNLIFMETKEQCVTDVENLLVHACLVFPEVFEIAEGNENRIEIYVDNSQVNIVDLIQNALNNVIIGESTAISSDLTRILITAIKDVSGKLDTWKSRINNDILSIQNELATSVDSGNVQLVNLDTTYTDPNKIVDDLEFYSSSIDERFDYVVSVADNAVDELTKVATAVRSENISGLNEIAEDALEKAEQLDQELHNNSESNAEIEGLSSAVAAAIGSLNELSRALDNAAQVKSDLSTKFQGYKTQVAQTKEKLTVLAVEMDVTRAMLGNIKIKNATNIVSPVNSQVVPVVTSATKLNFVFPSLMVLVIMFVSIMLGATIVVLEKVSPAKFRLFTTPTSDIWFITSIFITVFLVALLQIFILVGVGAFIFDLPVISNMHNTIVLLLLTTTIFTLIGMGLGYLFSNEQTTILGAISVGSAFILFSDVFLPIENIPLAMRQVLEYTPFILLSDMLRRTIIFDSPLKALGLDIIIIVAYCVTLFAIIVGAHKLLKIITIFGAIRQDKKLK